MSAILSSLGRVAMSQPMALSPDYDGLEYKFLNMSFRPATFQAEGVILLFLFALLGWFIVGKNWSQGRAKKWWSAFETHFGKQFRALSPLPNQKLVSDGPSTVLYYLTGRRNCLYLHMIFDLIPRHSIVQWLSDTVWALIVDPSASGPEDTVTLDFTLGEGAKGGRGQLGEGPGVWALVDKSGGILREIRKERWDTTFTKAQEMPASAIPATHMVLSESHDVSEYILKTPGVGLGDVMADPKVARWLKSLIISDQPPMRPSKGPLPEHLKARRLTMVLRCPSSQAQIEETMPLVQVAFNLIDMMAKVPVKPEVTRKLRKVRTEVDQELAKAYEKSKREEDEENGIKSREELKREAKRKAEKERRALLSPEEQRKLEEKDRKKAMRKSSQMKRA